MAKVFDRALLTDCGKEISSDIQAIRIMGGSPGELSEDLVT